MRRPLAFLLGGLALAAAAWPAAADELQDWQHAASVHIVQFLDYPPAENRAGWAGRTFVRFKVDRNGRVRDVAIAASSGRPGLDRAAIRAVRAANPVPPPTFLSPGDSISATLPVTFRQRPPATRGVVDRRAIAP